MPDSKRDERSTMRPGEAEEQREAEVQAVADYQPKGGDDLIPPKEDRPADGELGAGD
jgi:hypothetical protein